MPSLNLIKAIAVTAELTGTQFSEIAAEVMANDLARPRSGRCNSKPMVHWMRPPAHFPSISLCP